MTMWKRLNIDDLRTILSEDEIERLNTLSVDDSIENVVNNGIDLISDMWRGALSAKGYTLSKDEYSTPPEYRYWILIHARWAIWTRFPNTPDIALDKAREAEYKQAMELLKNPYINVSKPDGEGDKDEDIGTGGIYVPPQRFPAWYYGEF